MSAPVLAATASEIVFVAAAVAVGLLLAFQLRLTRKLVGMEQEVKRLRTEHRDGTLDARSRLEEASKALETLEETVAPRLEALEPHLADVGSRLDEMEEQLRGVTPRLEAADQRGAEAEAALTDARTKMEQADELVRGAGERFGQLDEAIRDARTRTAEATDGLAQLRHALTERLDALEGRIEDLGGVVAALAERAPAPGGLRRADRGDEARRERRLGAAAARGEARPPRRALGAGGVVLIVLGLVALALLAVFWLLSPRT